MTGKGDMPRPYAVDKETFNNNFDRIFNKREREQITEVNHSIYHERQPHALRYEKGS